MVLFHKSGWSDLWGGCGGLGKFLLTSLKRLSITGRGCSWPGRRAQDWQALGRNIVGGRREMVGE